MILPHNHRRFNHVVAFEVAKQSLTLHLLPADRQEIIANTAAAVRRVLQRELRRNQSGDLGAMLVVCEATGGYERHVLAAASELAIPVHRAHGARTRLFAGYLGLAAKTDAIDGRMLALYGRDTPDLRLYRPPSAQEEALRSLRRRRDDMLKMIRMESNRLEHAGHKRVTVSIKSHIRSMKAEIAALEREIAALVAETPSLHARSKLMQSLKGVGPATATACLAYLPELGTLSKSAVANLAGLAPIARDSGKFNAPRHIQGGRAVLRQSLYMAAVVAISHNPKMRAFAQSMKQRGKPPKLVITAVMRKLIITLNAMIRDLKPAYA